MSKVLIIPDGRPFWRKEKINSVDKVVYPYGYEGITRENAIEVQFKVDNPDKVLLGNHDCAYCYDAELIKEMFEQLKYFSEGILYTHAGVTNDWLKSMELLTSLLA